MSNKTIVLFRITCAPDNCRSSAKPRKWVNEPIDNFATCRGFGDHVGRLWLNSRAKGNSKTESASARFFREWQDGAVMSTVRLWDRRQLLITWAITVNNWLMPYAGIHINTYIYVSISWTFRCSWQIWNRFKFVMNKIERYHNTSNIIQVKCYTNLVSKPRIVKSRLCRCYVIKTQNSRLFRCLTMRCVFFIESYRIHTLSFIHL